MCCRTSLGSKTSVIPNYLIAQCVAVGTKVQKPTMILRTLLQTLLQTLLRTLLLTLLLTFLLTLLLMLLVM